MSRPRLSQEEIRSKEVKVRFSMEEYDILLDTMDKCGHESPAAFLRVSGLRSKIPHRIKIEVPQVNQEVLQMVIKLLGKQDAAIDREKNTDLSEMMSEVRGVISDVAKFISQHNNPKIIINNKEGE